MVERSTLLPVRLDIDRLQMPGLIGQLRMRTVFLRLQKDAGTKISAELCE